MEKYNSFNNALDDLRKRGYTADFQTPSFCLYCGDLDMRLNEEEFHVDEVYRFDADKDPANNAVIYAVSYSTGVKGTIVDQNFTDSCQLSIKTLNQ